MKIFKWRKDAKHEDVYITLLKIGKDSGFKGVNMPGIIKQLKDAGHVAHEDFELYTKYADNKDISPIDRNVEAEFTDSDFFKDYEKILDLVTKAFDDYRISDKNIRKYTVYNLKMESYFHLIEHQKLVESRRSSTKAILISLIAIVFSIGTFIYNVYKPMKITSEELVRVDQNVETIEALIEKQNKSQDVMSDEIEKLNIQAERISENIELLNTQADLVSGFIEGMSEGKQIPKEVVPQNNPN